MASSVPSLPDYPDSRTVSPDGRLIRQLREDKGLQKNELAQRAKCNLTTVRKVEAGRPAYPCTLRRFANALEVDYHSIIKKPQTRANPAPSTDEPPASTYEQQKHIRLILSIPFEMFDETTMLVQFITQLTQLMSPILPIEVIAIREGTTKVDLRVDVGTWYWLIKKVNPFMGQDTGYPLIDSILFVLEMGADGVPYVDEDQVYERYNVRRDDPRLNDLHGLSLSEDDREEPHNNASE
jgi:transcriptional regulator with XRE-family HTH domain